MRRTQDPPLFHFLSEERVIIERLVEVVRKILGRADMSPRQIHTAGVFLNTLLRLPLSTEGVNLNLTLGLRGEEGGYWSGVNIDDKRLEFESGESVVSDCGTDNDSRSIYYVAVSERDSENALERVLSWIGNLSVLAGDEEVKVDFEDLGRAPKQWSDELDEDAWKQLPDWEMKDEEEMEGD